MTWLCAYAITRDRPAGSGLGTTHLIGYRELGVIVADLGRGRFGGRVDGAVAELAREHEAVVHAVFRQEPVLPLRFGTLLNGEAAAIRLLRSGYERTRARLDAVAGHREWAVRVRCADPDPACFPVRRRDRLKAVERCREDVARFAERLDETLRRHASAGTHRARAHGVLVNTAYLVAQEREADFHSEFEWLARELRGAGASVESTGPWPPYSFADFDPVGLS